MARAFSPAPLLCMLPPELAVAPQPLLEKLAAVEALTRTDVSQEGALALAEAAPPNATLVGLIPAAMAPTALAQRIKQQRADLGVLFVELAAKPGAERLVLIDHRGKKAIRAEVDAREVWPALSHRLTTPVVRGPSWLASFAAGLTVALGAGALIVAAGRDGAQQITAPAAEPARTAKPEPAKVEPPKPEPPKPQPPKEPAKVEPPKEPAKVEPPKEPAKVEPPKEPAKVEPPKEPAKVEPPKPEPPKPEPPKPEPPKPEPPKPEPPKPAAAAGGVIDLPLKFHSTWRTPAPTSPAELAAAVARLPAGGELVLHCPPSGATCDALATERAKKTLSLLRDRGARLTRFRLEPDPAGWRAVVLPPP